MLSVHRFWLGSLLWILFSGQAPAAPRPVTVADIIGITLPRDIGAHQQNKVQAAPDGARFAVLVNRGDLAAGVRRFEIWLFDSEACLKSACKPQVIASASSPDNLPGLDQLHWVGDEALAYLGRDAHGRLQVFRYDVAAGQTHQLTISELGVRNFDLSRDGRKLVYMERGVRKPLFATETDRYRGVQAGDLPFASLLTESGETYPNNLAFEEPGDIVFVNDGLARHVSMSSAAKCPPDIGFDLSPDGHRVLMHCYLPIRDLPHGQAYLDGDYGLTWTETIVPWVISDDGDSRRLVDTPLPAHGGTIAQYWSGDGRAVILHTLSSPEEANGDPKTGEAVEIDVRSGARTVIARGAMDITAWDPDTGRLVLKPKTLSSEQPSAAAMAYVRSPAGWRLLGPERRRSSAGPRVLEDYRTPPILAMISADGKLVRKVLDFDPQLSDLALGEVRNLSISVAGEPAPISYGLYLPVGFQAGRRYPVVVQTHGWDAQSFQIEGFGSAGYAAQVLAGKGFIVVQTGESTVLSTPEEGQANLAVYEAILDDLDRKGMIDTRRIGIQGWSRTGVSVRWALLHSKYRFAAALLVDTMTLNYMEYLTGEGVGQEFQDTLEAINGSSPIGRNGLKIWSRTSPAFNFEDIRTPIKIFAFQPPVLAASWEDYVVLKHLGKPVELTYLPDANHWPLRPLERLTVQDGAVDWWSYWLLGKKSQDLAKANQYRRWDALRIGAH